MALGCRGGDRAWAMQGERSSEVPGSERKATEGCQGSKAELSQKPCQEVKPARAVSRMAQQGRAFCTNPRLLLVGSHGHSCVLETGSGQQWAPCLTTLILWPVGTVEQGLVRVPEELVPGHRVYKAEAGIVVDEGQPTAQFPQ